MGQILSWLCPLGTYDATDHTAVVRVIALPPKSELTSVYSQEPHTTDPEEINASPPEINVEVNVAQEDSALFDESASTSNAHDVDRLLAQAVEEYQAFFTTHEIRRLDAAIDVERKALHLCPTGHRRRHVCLYNLASSLGIRSQQNEDSEDFTEAIQMFQEMLQLLPPDHSEFTSTVRKLAASLARQLERNGNGQDPDPFVERKPVPASHPEILELLQTSKREHQKYLDTRDLVHLDRTVNAERGLLKLHPTYQPMRGALLNNLSAHLSDRFDQTGNLADIEEAIEMSREALALRPPGHPDRGASLNNLANHLGGRFGQTGDPADNEEAIEMSREALALRPPGHPNRGNTLNNLANHLSGRFVQTRNLSDIEEAIEMGREALALRPPGRSDRGNSLNNLSIHLIARFCQTGNLADIEEAIEMSREALALRPPGHPDHGASLNNLASHLSDRFGQTGNLADISEAIEMGREALVLFPPGHPNRGDSLDGLSNHLSNRFGQTGNLADISEAIEMGREALILHPPGHPNRGTSLNNLAYRLSTRFRQTGNFADISEAIEMSREALVLRPPGHPNRGDSLNNLSAHLRDRFGQTGNLADISEAIEMGREALVLFPPGHPNRGASLNNVAIDLRDRFGQTGNLADTEEAIEMSREALALRPSGHSDRGDPLNNLSTHLSDRFDQTGNLADIEEAIEMSREALILHPPGHPNRGTSLNNLAKRLSTRFGQTGNLADISQAIEMSREALVLRPPGHPNRAVALAGLADCFRRQLQHQDSLRGLAPSSGDQAGPPSDSPRSRAQTINNLMDALREAAHPSPAFLSVRLQAAHNWRLFSRIYNHESKLEAMITSLNVVDESISQPRSLQSLFQYVSNNTLIQEAQTVASNAAALAIEHGDVSLAVTLLERGRTMIFNQLGRFRKTHDDIRQVAPELAQKFAELSDVLNDLVLHGETSVSFRSAAAKDLGVVYQQKHSEWEKTAADIRKIPGFESFMGRPSFEHLQQAAAAGPVVFININGARSDAIIIRSPGDPVLVLLPNATPKKLEALANRLGVRPAACKEADLITVLQDLWEVVVSPIVDGLRSPAINLQQESRMWWCPTGVASRLPLHAAGPYLPRKKNFSDRYISSYTPTLGALVQARRIRSVNLDSRVTPAILVVGQPDTPNAPELPGVLAELKAIEEHAPSANILLSKEGSREAVLNGIDKHEWVHLACHGNHNDEQLLLSHFSMYDGPITLQDLIEKPLPLAQFAFLSACHSARVSEALPDEVLHPAASMMFAGYKSVIGTMWALDDTLGKPLAGKFYELMMKEEDGSRKGYSDAAAVLRAAFKALVKEGFRLDLIQRINAVHYGA